jgi:hypothetical protein
MDDLGLGPFQLGIEVLAGRRARGEHGEQGEWRERSDWFHGQAKGEVEG